MSEERFLLHCKLTGNGAFNLSASYTGTKRDIDNYLNDIAKDGFQASEVTIEPFSNTYSQRELSHSDDFL